MAVVRRKSYFGNTHVTCKLADRYFCQKTWCKRNVFNDATGLVQFPLYESTVYFTSDINIDTFATCRKAIKSFGSKRQHIIALKDEINTWLSTQQMALHRPWLINSILKNYNDIGHRQLQRVTIRVDLRIARMHCLVKWGK